jgi:Cupredoxin-like domain
MMTAASHRVRSATGSLVVLATAVLLLTVLACGGRHHRRHHGFSEESGPIQVVTTQVGGKNVFIPSTLVVTSGHPVELSIFNTTDIPHGFRIPALGIEEVLPAQEEHVVSLPPLEPNQVLRIVCHLHTAHRTATLVVLPSDGPPASSD